MNQIIPIPRIAINVRPGTMDDLSFIDSLQKMHTRQVGWMPTKQFEGKIRLGHVLVAEQVASCELLVASEDQPATRNKQPATPLGYLIGNDQYFKRDDLGIIYQLNVAPTKQRGLIGASLLKAQFDRSAYGCKLYCCWCAQDIEANRFWEAMGFVPLAFRAGSRGKGRVHIFWQRRIRAGDVTTPYWFPSQTTSGAIREDRIVLPIPPGTHWRDAKPIVLPSEASAELKVLSAEDQKKPRRKRTQNSAGTRDSGCRTQHSIRRNGLVFDIPKQGEALPVVRAQKQPKKKTRNDPKLVAAARELRDRWLEKVNDDPSLLESSGKYEVARAIVDETPAPVTPLQLPAAA
jgi:hypothetical protein